MGATSITSSGNKKCVQYFNQFSMKGLLMKFVLARKIGSNSAIMLKIQACV
jgi:hypothetical protein